MGLAWLSLQSLSRAQACPGCSATRGGGLSNCPGVPDEGKAEQFQKKATVPGKTLLT